MNKPDTTKRYSKAKRVPNGYIRSDAELLEFVMERIEKRDNGCWIWLPCKNTDGYGFLIINRQRWIVHRLMYKLHHGSLPEYDGKTQTAVICHSCDTPACCNPDHLFIGSQTDNMKDATRKKRWAKQHKTHCRNGHEYAAVGVYVVTNSKGHHMRHCRKCDLIKNRLRAGWTREQAELLPVVPKGYRRGNGSTNSAGDSQK